LAQVEASLQQDHLPGLTLLLDEVVASKSGKAFAWLGVRSSSPFDKTVRGPCFVVFYAVLGPFRFPVPYRRYLNEASCPAAGLEFKPKPQLALELLKEFTFSPTLAIGPLGLFVAGGSIEKDLPDYAGSEGGHFYARLASPRILEALQYPGVLGKASYKPLSQGKSGDVVTPLPIWESKSKETVNSGRKALDP